MSGQEGLLKVFYDDKKDPIGEALSKRIDRRKEKKEAEDEQQD